MKKKQKDVFLDSEADAWFERNHSAMQERNFGQNDRIIQAIYACLCSDSQKVGGGVTCSKWVAVQVNVCTG